MISTTGRNADRGFTLLELILVMVIISAVLGLAAPSLRGFFASRKAHDTAAGILSLIRLARSQAITEGRSYRLNLDTEAGSYWLTVNDAGGYARLDTDMGRKFLLPERTSMKVAAAGGDEKDKTEALETIEFYPEGRADVRTIRVFDQSGGEVDILCLSPAERYRIVVPQETAR